MPKLYYKDPSGEFIEYTPVASIPQEWKDKVDGKVDDVRIGGTSIVQDGVADLPAPTGYNGHAGIVNTWGDYGLTLNGYNLRINSASASEIASKTGSYRPLVGNQIDSIVRSGLLSNTKITDADKPLICQTVGAKSNVGYETLIDTVLSEAQSVITVNDTDGFSRILAIVEVESFIHDAITYLYMNALDGDLVDKRICTSNGVSSNINQLYITAEILLENGLVSGSFKYWTSDPESHNGTMLSTRSYPIVGLKGIKVGSTNGSSKFPVGTKVHIYGVR